MADKKKKQPLGRVGRVEQEKRYNTIIRYVTYVIVGIVLVVTAVGLVMNAIIIPGQTIATVDGEEIITRDFQSRVRLERDRMVSEYSFYQQMLYTAQDANSQAMYQYYMEQVEAQLEVETLGERVLNQMVDEIFIIREAESRGITVTEDEITDYIFELFSYYPDGVPTPTTAPTMLPTSTLSAAQYAMLTPTPSPTPLEDDVEEEPTVVPEPTFVVEPTGEALPTSITSDEYSTRLDEYLARVGEYGVDEAFLRNLIRIQIFRDKLNAELEKGITPAQEEVWARHILVADKETAETILKELAAGGDWSDLVTEYSTEPGAADRAGDLGWFSRGMMVAEFEEAAFAAEVGDIIGPVETSFGFHIIQIVGHELRPVDETGYAQLVNTALTELLNQMKEEAVVEFADGWQSRIPDKPAITVVNPVQ